MLELEFNLGVLIFYLMFLDGNINFLFLVLKIL